MKAWCIACLAAVSIGSPAMAQQAETYLTGNDLLSLCKSASQAHQNYCSGYVTGALDHQRLIEAMTRATKAVCIPANVTSKQLADVVVRDLEAKPAKRHYSATSLAIGALMDAFPCR